jgi:hypothetical protein
MGQIEKSASSLREKITTMQRTLPPFPPGSQERVRLLKSYVGLRKLIEQLTIPPEVPLFRQKKELDLPEISNPDSDQEWKTAVKGLDKTLGAIQQGKVLTERGS